MSFDADAHARKLAADELYVRSILYGLNLRERRHREPTPAAEIWHAYSTDWHMHCSCWMSIAYKRRRASWTQYQQA